jgi:hypothetical protein
VHYFLAYLKSNIVGDNGRMLHVDIDAFSPFEGGIEDILQGNMLCNSA